MKEKTMQEFIANAKNLILDAILDDEFVKISTEKGNAVLISEAEWNILVEGMKELLALTTNK